MALHTPHSSPTKPSDRHVHSHDPATGAPDFHPVGTGVGAATGGVMVGAAAGAIAGPVGAAIGAAAGAFAGAAAGKAIAHRIDSDLEDAYWRDNYASQPYVSAGSSYDDYGPAYRYGVSTYDAFRGRPFDEAEEELSRDWGHFRGRSQLEWAHARHATRASWDRLNKQFPPDPTV